LFKIFAIAAHNANSFAAAHIVQWWQAHAYPSHAMNTDQHSQMVIFLNVSFFRFSAFFRKYFSNLGRKYFSNLGLHSIVVPLSGGQVLAWPPVLRESRVIDRHS